MAIILSKSFPVYTLVMKRIEDFFGNGKGCIKEGERGALSPMDRQDQQPTAAFFLAGAAAAGLMLFM